MALFRKIVLAITRNPAIFKLVREIENSDSFRQYTLFAILKNENGRSK